MLITTLTERIFRVSLGTVCIRSVLAGVLEITGKLTESLQNW